MEVVIQTQHPDAHAIREWVEARVRFVTQRLSGVVSRAVVRLKDLNGPRGGVDKHCQIQLSTARGGVLVVSSRGGDWRATLDMALSRAAHALTRQVNSRKPHPAKKPGVVSAQQTG
jgi:hypothetical protein